MADTQDKSKRGKLTGTKVGVVVADKADKTRKVAIRFSYRHPKYGKTLKRLTHLQVHDPENASKLGDEVEVAACRPISKNKSWRLVQIVKASPGSQRTHVETAGSEPEQKDDA